MAKLTGHRAWLLLVAIIALLISWVSRLPQYHGQEDLPQRIDSQFLTWQAHHPLTPNTEFLKPLEQYQGDELGRVSHLYKTSYRLTMPLLSRLTPLGIWSWIVLPGICGAIFFPIICLLASQLTGDRVTAALFTWAYAACAAGHQFFGEFWLLYGDGVAYLLLAVAALSQRPVVVFLSLFLAAFTDERGVVAGGIIYFLQSSRSGTLETWRLSSLWPRTSVMWATLAACASYLIARIALHLIFGLKNDQSALLTLDVLLHHLRHNIPHHLFGAFETLWILPLLALVAAFAVRNLSWALCFLALLCGAVVCGFVVLDLQRSLAFMFPLLFCSLWALAKEPALTLRRLMTAVLLISLLWCDLHRSLIFGIYLLARDAA